jgi:mannose-1-phosphate guanylyltransferase
MGNQEAETSEKVCEQHYYGVVMAGGGGTRLWPLSRKKRPKQMLNLFGEQTLFQASVRRLYDVLPPENVYVVTIADQAKELSAQAPEIPAENFLIEPAPRGTASVVGLAAAVLAERDPQCVMAVVTADHYIGNQALYNQLLVAAYHAAQDQFLVTLGIEPTFPSTGFGYIQRGEQVGTYESIPVYRVQRFKEKPDQDQAIQMLASSDHDWNSGMFFWRVDCILAEFKRQMPHLMQGLEQIRSGWNSPERASIVAQVWQELAIETIDYGIMEHARNVAVLPAAGLKWNDVGAWESLYQMLNSDDNGNIIVGGKHIALDTHQTLVYMDREYRLIVTIGVDDLVVVDTGDVLMICRKDQAQRVRQIVNQLTVDGQDYL